MAQNAAQSATWVNPLPTVVDQNWEIILGSLSQWLSNPTFQQGITVGNGTPPAYDPATGAQTAPAPYTLINLNSITQAPSDTSTPGTPSVTAVGGIRSILAYWPAILTASGSPMASYVAEVASDSGFVTIVQTLNPVGPVASFDNLTANTTYYVRVAGVSYAGVQGAWSSTATVTTPQIAAGDIAANTITAGSAIIGSAAISSAQIASLVANKITAGTINAQTIQLGATGGTAAIQSTNYVAGSTGWAVLGDGTSQFSGVTINGGMLKVGSSTGPQVEVFTDTAMGTIAFLYNSVEHLRLFSASDNGLHLAYSVGGGWADVAQFYGGSTTTASFALLGANNSSIASSAPNGFISIQAGSGQNVNLDTSSGGLVVVNGVSITPDTGWTAATLNAPWVVTGAPYANCTYRKDGTWVHLRGAIKSGTLASVAFTLPAGYRPAATMIFPVYSSGGVFGGVQIDTSGNVTPVAGSTAGLWLENVSFSTI